MTLNADEPKQAEKLLQDPTHLLTLYKEQFRHLRHLEHADSLSLAFITLLVLGIFVLFHTPFIKEEPHDILALGIAAILAIGGPGIYGTTRRMTYRMLHIAIINRVGVVIGAVRAGVIPASTGSELPGNLWRFWKKLILGYRGPTIVFYSALIWVVVFSLIFEIANGIESWLLAGVIGLGIVAFANLTSILTSWHELKQEILTLKQEVELGTSTHKTMTEQHCDLADALIRLRPPHLGEALNHYQKALELETENTRAKEGVDKLMNWRVKDFR